MSNTKQDVSPFCPQKELMLKQASNSLEEFFGLHTIYRLPCCPWNDAFSPKTNRFRLRVKKQLLEAYVKFQGLTNSCIPVAIHHDKTLSLKCFWILKMLLHFFASIQRFTEAKFFV